MERTTVYFPEDLHRKVAALSQETGRSQAEIIREALRSYVDRQTKPPLPFVGLGHNPDMDAAKTDDWLREHWRPD